jgi:ribonuclease Y
MSFIQQNLLVVILAVLVLAGGGIALGWWLNNRLGRNSLEAARRRIDEMLRGSRREAEKAKRTALLQAREESYEYRNKVERDLRSKKGQLVKRERDLNRHRQKIQDLESDLESRREQLDQVEKGLSEREAEIEGIRAEVDRLIEEQNVRLEQVSGMTREEARRQLLRNLRGEARYEAATLIKKIKDDAQRTADKEAVKIISLAVERAASEFSAERTVSQFSAERTVSQFELPSGNNVRGRIIGQEGKNIRAFEKATGIQLLIDEEANTVTLSGFNPVHREIARRVLEQLLKNGNIHPRRIEELSRRVRRRLDDEMRRSGNEVLKELGVKGVHPEMVTLLGRLKFRTSYGQNVLLHSKEVAYLTGMLASELRMDEKLARRAGLFHDIGKAIDYEREGTHPEIGAEVGLKYGEPEVVVNAIASHHEDCEVTSPISVLVAAADALSGARPGARRKSVAEYIKRIEKLEELANSMEGVEQSYALHAGREIRVIARTQLVDDARVELLASDLAGRIQSEMDYPGKIKVTVIRQVRAVDYARGAAANN